MSKEEKPVRLSKKEVLARAAKNWLAYKDRLANEGITYERYIKDVLAEWEKQKRLSDKDLIKYRKDAGMKITREIKKQFPKENEAFDRDEEKKGEGK